LALYAPWGPRILGQLARKEVGNPGNSIVLTMILSNIFADASKARSFAAGTVIFEKGSKGDEMYVVKEGEVDIVIDDCNFETLSPEGIFGELSLIDQETRIASAIARTDCTVQAIDKRRFLFLVQETPLFAIQVMKIMANRLRRVDLIVAKSHSGPLSLDEG